MIAHNAWPIDLKAGLVLYASSVSPIRKPTAQAMSIPISLRLEVNMNSLKRYGETVNTSRNTIKNEIPPNAGLEVVFQRMTLSSIFLIPIFFENFKKILLIRILKPIAAKNKRETLKINSLFIRMDFLIDENSLIHYL